MPKEDSTYWENKFLELEEHFYQRCFIDEESYKEKSHCIIKIREVFLNHLKNGRRNGNFTCGSPELSDRYLRMMRVFDEFQRWHMMINSKWHKKSSMQYEISFVGGEFETLYFLPANHVFYLFREYVETIERLSKYDNLNKTSYEAINKAYDHFSKAHEILSEPIAEIVYSYIPKEVFIALLYNLNNMKLIRQLASVGYLEQMQKTPKFGLGYLKDLWQMYPVRIPAIYEQMIREAKISRKHKAWYKTEEQDLIDGYNLGIDVRHLSMAFSRSQSSIIAKLRTLGVKVSQYK